MRRRRVKDKQNDRDFLPLNVWNIRIINLLNPGASGVPPVHFWIHPLFNLSASIRFSPQLSLTSRSHKGLFNHDFMCWSLYCQFTFCASSITGSAADKMIPTKFKSTRVCGGPPPHPWWHPWLQFRYFDPVWHVPYTMEYRYWQNAIITPWLD